MTDAVQPASYMCTAMNDCNGNGTCGDNGVCTCNEGFKFGDCSLQSSELIGGFSTTIEKVGPMWFSYYRKKGAKNQQLLV